MRTRGRRSRRRLRPTPVVQLQRRWDLRLHPHRASARSGDSASPRKGAAPHRRWPVGGGRGRPLRRPTCTGRANLSPGPHRIRRRNDDQAPTGFVVGGDYASNTGWAIAGSTVFAVGDAASGATIVRVNLRTRVVSTFPIIERRRLPVRQIAVTRNEIWLGDTEQPRIVRYNRTRPQKPQGYLALPGKPSKNDTAVSLRTGAGAIWATVEDPDGVHVYRLSTR